ncbi:MAG: MOSC domain-containing protein [Actinomycetota bacterium]|nr:MOSC domain-containing protein [Acidimicrobiia bacterium]MDQ3293980.1 MOSC domain-containing protein [Actinomycetota bacterium]
MVPAAEYTSLELDGTIRAIGPWWALLLDGLDPTPVAALAREQGELLAAGLGRVELVDRSLALLRQAGRALAAAGAYPTAAGTVHGLFRSGGGVPKQPVDTVIVDARGVVGDRQRSKRHHGRPWQALCLWSLEVVERLRAEGHPIAPGAAGENVSVTGIDWRLARPGMRLQLGADVLVELSPWSLPCSKNAPWFLGGDYERMHHERELGVSRIYASVVQGGTLSTGDEVVLEP